MPDKNDQMVKIPEGGIDTKGLVPASEPPEPAKPLESSEPPKQDENK